MGRVRLAALLGALLSFSAIAQEGLLEISLYEGDLSKAKGLSVGPWGSGSVEEVDDVNFRGHSVLLIYTEGLYAGGRLEWSPPKDVRGILADKFGYLRMAVKVPRKEALPGVPVGPEAPGFPGMPGMPGFEGVPPFGMPLQMMLGQVWPGMPPWPPGGREFPGMPRPTRLERRPPREIEALRILIQAEGGWLALPYLDLEAFESGPEGWLELDIPLKRFSKVGEIRPESKLRRLLIFGDAEGEIYVGRIALARDASPIRLTALAEIGGRISTEVDCLVGDTVVFTAEVEGGLATVEVRWDFDASDGVGIDATGLRVEHAFEKPGDYVVTAVAVDPDGVKGEARATLKVHVHPAE
ncbi:MAG TPA: PKD domain-containing protein [Armatimonadetes bacterium]|nr:PKD domain-containing protein [Armatimonadota bacterium]